MIQRSPEGSLPQPSAAVLEGFKGQLQSEPSHTLITLPFSQNGNEGDYVTWFITDIFKYLLMPY